VRSNPRKDVAIVVFHLPFPWLEPRNHCKPPTRFSQPSFGYSTKWNRQTEPQQETAALAKVLAVPNHFGSALPLRRKTAHKKCRNICCSSQKELSGPYPSMAGRYGQKKRIFPTSFSALGHSLDNASRFFPPRRDSKAGFLVLRHKTALTLSHKSPGPSMGSSRFLRASFRGLRRRKGLKPLINSGQFFRV